MSVIEAFARTKRLARAGSLWIQVAGLTAGLLAPLFMLTTPASAAQITSRSVTITTSKASAATVQYTYGFSPATAAAIQSIGFQACTTPLGTCTSPGGTISMNAGSQVGTVGGSWTNTTGFTRDAAGAGGCTATTNMLCIKRTQAAAESTAAKTVTWDTQTNPTAVGSYFVRISLYSDTAWATGTDSGVVAYAIVSQLTINARIQEILNFCVGTTTINDATTTPGADCSAITGTTVDIGVLDSGSVNTSPVSTNGGSSTNGLAMVRTNAQIGAVISYFSNQDTSSGSLKVAGATCTGGDTTLATGVKTDQCINDSATQNVLAAGTENFGMTIAGTNCGSTSSYTCVLTSGSNKLHASGQYIGATTTSYGTSTGFAWNDTGTTTTIASSSTVVDDEALILRFAATPSITTPTGAYTVTSTYIATVTY
jgi:hypothetical protein